jgi:hypothetical protein
VTAVSLDRPELDPWAEEHPELVEQQTRRANQGGWRRVQRKTAVLLAAADHARADLEEQAGGAAPTLRAVFYRLVARYGLPKSDASYEQLGYAAARARKGGSWSRFALADDGMPAMNTPFDTTVAEALAWALSYVSARATPSSAPASRWP